MDTLTVAQHATNDDTWHHIHRVQELLNAMAFKLIERGHQHDQSKLKSPEVEGLTETNDRLKTLKYPSPEYDQSLKDLDVPLGHHYANNRHHPQHFKNGINDMNLLDIMEMFCDWKAGSERVNNGNIRTSIEANANRFGIHPQLVKIFENTIEALIPPK